MAGPYSDSSSPAAAPKASPPAVAARFTGARSQTAPGPPGGSPVVVAGQAGGGLALGAGGLGHEVEDQLQLLVVVAGPQLLQRPEPVDEQRGHGGVDPLGGAPAEDV